MKTKQQYMKAVFAKPINKISRVEKPLLQRWVIVDKKTERTIIDCRAYMSASANSSMVYADIWINNIKPEKLNAEAFTVKDKWSAGGTYIETCVSGSGRAGGWGYHKTSAAVASAISAAGVELYGTPYGRPVNNETPADARKRLKERCHIGGVGDGAIISALLAIAHAAGYNDVIMVN